MENRKLPIRLLALEQSPGDAERWVTLFRNAGFPPRVKSVASLETLEQTLDEQQWDAIISAEETSSLSAHQILLTLKRKDQDIPVIVTLNDYIPEAASRWLEAGARDAIPAASEQHILQAVIRELSALQTRRQLQISQQKLTEVSERCQLLLTNATEAIAYIHYGMHIDANNAYLELLGYKNSDDLAGISLLDMVKSESKDVIKQYLKKLQSGQQLQPFECHLAHSDGHFIPATIKLSEAQYDNEPCIQATIHPAPVSVSQPVPEKHLISTREQLFNKAEERLQSAASITLIWLQIDDYDNIRRTTDISGILSIQQNITTLICEEMPDTMSCHYGDDVFLILDTAMGVDDTYSALNRLQSVIDHFLFGSDKETLTITTTIGFATHQDSSDLNDLISCAQIAYEHCLQDEEVRIKQYCRTEEVRIKAQDGDVQARVEHALSNESFQVSFQPVINITGTVGKHHYEILVDIPGTGDEVVGVRDYMEAKELSKLMPLVDRWTLRQSVLELTRKRKKGETPRLIIHISHWSIQDPKFMPYLVNLLKAAELPADSIVLQLQQSVAMQQLKGLVELSNSLQKIGCLLSINDFQGDSKSLKLLQHLNLYLVQLDGKFIGMLGKKKHPTAGECSEQPGRYQHPLCRIGRGKFSVYRPSLADGH